MVKGNGKFEGQVLISLKEEGRRLEKCAGGGKEGGKSRKEQCFAIRSRKAQAAAIVPPGKREGHLNRNESYSLNARAGRGKVEIDRKTESDTKRED